MRSFCVSRPFVSSTLYTSFAEGGRCPSRAEVFLLAIVFTTKTIPHSGSPYSGKNSQLLSLSLYTFSNGIVFALRLIHISVQRVSCGKYHRDMHPYRSKLSNCPPGLGILRKILPKNDPLNNSRTYTNMSNHNCERPMPGWRKGYAADCRSVYPGSIPGPGSFPDFNCPKGGNVVGHVRSAFSLQLLHPIWNTQGSLVFLPAGEQMCPGETRDTLYLGDKYII